MKLDITQLLYDHNIPFITEGTKHCAQGWVQIVCPFCAGNPGWHLGYNKGEGYFNCWRCGWYPAHVVLSKLLEQGERQIKQLIKEYKLRPSRESTTTRRQIAKNNLSTLTLPLGAGPLTERHLSYLLKKRKYDNPERLAHKWQLQGTGPVGPYKFRIIAPVFHNGQMVSYQGRDITGKYTLPYKACPQHLELRPHKHCLYGLEHVQDWRKEIIVVEGITDTWRLGAGNAIAVFGIEWKGPQLKLLKERFEKVYVFFDQDPQAIKQAEKLAHALIKFRIDTRILQTTTDPDSLTKEEVKTLLQKLSLK